MNFDTDLMTELIRLSLEEDVGGGDLTSRACVDSSIKGEATIVSRSDAVVSGQEIARAIFKAVDENTRYMPLAGDGESVTPDVEIASITGKLASILTAERTALNFLMRLSGVATATRRFVDEVEGTGAKILDTRKTTPGFRFAEKYAVVCGGGANHRKGLYDMILIKDNHIRAAGSIPVALKRCQDYVQDSGLVVPVEVEVASSAELEQAITSGAKWIMLDNMTVDQIRTAVARIRSEQRDIKIEISGGVNIKNVRELAECGVDYISVGALTHSSPAVDFSLNVVKIVD